MSLTEISRTSSGKGLLAALALSTVCLVGLSIAAVLQGEGVDGFAFATLVASALCVAAIILSCWNGPAGAVLVKRFWIGFAVVLLVVNLLLWFNEAYDSDLALTYAMIVLTLPIGLMSVPITWMFLGDTGPFSMALVWVAGFASGYAQWFVLLPRFVRWLQNKRQG